MAVPDASDMILRAASTGKAAQASQCVSANLQIDATSRTSLQDTEVDQRKRLAAPERSRCSDDVLFVDEAIDHTRPWEKKIKPPATLAGDSLPLEVIIDSLDAHPAGRFSDTLVVELSAL